MGFSDGVMIVRAARADITLRKKSNQKRQNKATKRYLQFLHATRFVTEHLSVLVRDLELDAIFGVVCEQALGLFVSEHPRGVDRNSLEKIFHMNESKLL